MRKVAKTAVSVLAIMAVALVVKGIANERSDAEFMDGLVRDLQEIMNG